MPCIEPISVYSPQREPWTDLAHLAVAFLSKLVDRPQTHCGPMERPIALIEIRKEERLKKAQETWMSAANALHDRVTSADTHFKEICRVLTERSKSAAQTRGSYRSDFDFAKKEGKAVECGEIERDWHGLIATMNDLHREEARMLCAIESARSSYVLRQVCPDDPCNDFDRRSWLGYRHGCYPTWAREDSDRLDSVLQEKAEACERELGKAREGLAECENRIRELSEKVSHSDRALSDLDAKHQDALTKLEECEERWRTAEERLKSIEGSAEPPPEQGTAQEGGGQSDRRRRRS
jgi:hypothetical protein